MRSENPGKQKGGRGRVYLGEEGGNGRSVGEKSKGRGTGPGMRIKSGGNGVENTDEKSKKKQKDGAESRWGEIAEAQLCKEWSPLPAAELVLLYSLPTRAI